MKILNLVNQEKSDIKYKPQKFPDGQQNIVIELPEKTNYSYWKCTDKIQIKSRLNNWLDLELIVCAVASLREIDRDMEIHLYVPYFLGSRSDRKFEEGGNNYLKDVICPIINSLNFKSVTVLDSHSDVLEACIKGFKKESNENLIKFAFEDIPSMNGSMYKIIFSNIILVLPDAGASKKIYKLTEEIGYKGDIITCSKERDIDGKLTNVIVPITSKYLGKDLIIIDDICDGGATFINIAKKIRNHFVDFGGTSGKIYLIVTHGIFSKGFNELSKYFDGIYCTNSYKNLKGGENIIDISQKICKQLNVF